ncbi:MAG: type VI secretion system lipoprotein TssJ [bacterium]
MKLGNNLLGFKLFKNTICIIGFFLFLSACGADTVNITMKSSDDCNDKNAIVVKVFQLKSDEKIKRSTRDALLRNIETTLANDLIPNTKIEKTMVPGNYISLDDIEIKEEAAFIGFVADFHSPATDGWLLVFPLSSGEDDIKVLVERNYLALEKE